MCFVYTTLRSQPTLAQRRIRLADLLPFEHTVVVVTSGRTTAKKNTLRVCTAGRIIRMFGMASAATWRALHGRYDGTAGRLPAPC